MLDSIRGSNFVHRVVLSGGYYFGPARLSGDDALAQSLTIEEAIEQESLRRLDPLSQYALYAVENARRAAGIAKENHATKEAQHGICVGTALGAQNTRVRYTRRLARLGPAATNPIDFPDSIDGAPAAHIAIRWGLQGPCLTFVDGMASAVNALVAACRQVASGRAERMYVVAGDIFDPYLCESVATSLRPIVVTSPKDAILALILERFDVDIRRASPIEIVGFHGSNANGELWRLDNPVRDVTNPTAKMDTMDLSGVSMVAGAWLEVTAAMGNWVGSYRNDEMNIRGYRCNVGNRQYPNLAFLRIAR